MVFLNANQSNGIWEAVWRQWLVNRFPKEALDLLKKNVVDVWKACSIYWVSGLWMNKFAATAHQKNCRLKEIAAAVSGKKLTLPPVGAISFSKAEILAIGNLFGTEIHAERFKDIVNLLASNY